MEGRADAIRAGEADELVWLVEHPPLYTAGTSANPGDLLEPDRFPVYQAGRGGEYTYHGPGQRVAYVMLDLKRRREDVRAFVVALEDWVIQTLARFNVRGERRAGRIGVWVQRPDKPPLPDGSPMEDKIAAIGIAYASAAAVRDANVLAAAGGRSPSLPISPALCPAAFRASASPALSTSVCR